MKSIFIINSVTLFFFLPVCISFAQVHSLQTSNEILQDDNWKTSRVSKTIDNITFFFPSIISPGEREAFINDCLDAERICLAIISEEKFDALVDVEFFESREQLKKYTGITGMDMLVLTGIRCLLI